MYRNLKLENRKIGKVFVFIGLLLTYQYKDWRIYFKFVYFFIFESFVFEGILACGTDGEKALIDGFKRNFRFVIFLRCFIYFKDNIKREFSDREFNVGEK